MRFCGPVPYSASADGVGSSTDPAVDFRKWVMTSTSTGVTGHFLIVGDRLHITMEAVDTDADRIVWHDSFDVPPTTCLPCRSR